MARCGAHWHPSGITPSANAKIVSRKIFRGPRTDWDPGPGRRRSPECAPQHGASARRPSIDAGQQDPNHTPVERPSPRALARPSPTSDGPRLLSPVPVQDVQPTHAEQRGTQKKGGAPPTRHPSLRHPRTRLQGGDSGPRPPPAQAFGDCGPDTHSSLRNPVGAPGFEPGTSCSQSRRATGLRHTPPTALRTAEAREEREVNPAPRACPPHRHASPGGAVGTSPDHGRGGTAAFISNRSHHAASFHPPGVRSGAIGAQFAMGPPVGILHRLPVRSDRACRGWRR